MNARRVRGSVIVFFLLVSFWFFRGVFFRNEVFIGADALWRFYPWKTLSSEPVKPRNGLMMDSVQSIYPAYLFSSRWLHNGHVPLWNPHIMCGVPFAASGIGGLFYPLNAPFFVAGAPEEAFGWSGFIHLALAGIFGFALLRVLGAGNRGAVIGGLAFMFNGWLVAWMMQPNFLHAGIWLPLMVCLYELSVRRRKTVYALLGGVAGAMPFLAGQPQVGAYSHLFLAAYALYRTMADRGDRLRVAGCWLLCAAAAGGLSAVQLLPTFDLMQRGQRPVVGSILLFLRSPFDLKHLVLAFLPNFYGDPVRENYWGTQNYTTFCLYAGVAPLVLAIGAVARGKMRDRRFFAGAAVVTILLALGTPLNIFFIFLPGLNRLPSDRIIFLYSFAVSVLAGMGWQALERSGTEDRRKWAGIWAVYAALFFGCFLWAFSFVQGNRMAFLKFEGWGLLLWWALALVGVLVFLARNVRGPLKWIVLVFLILADSGLWANWYNPSVPRKFLFPETPSTQWLDADHRLFRVHGVGEDWVLFPNTAMYYGFFDIRGYESLYPGRYYELLQAVSVKQFGSRIPEPNVVDPYGYDSPIMDMLNVRYLLSTEPAPDAGGAGKYTEVFNGDIRITLNRGAMDRFFGMRRWRVLKNGKEVLDAVTSPGFDPRYEVLLNSKEIKRALKPPDADDGEPGVVPVRIRDIVYTPDEVTFKIGADERVMLASSESNDPGWHAYLSGEGIPEGEVPIFTANYHFRAIPVPPGEYDVAFRYRPVPVIAGAWISLLVSGLVLVLCLAGVLTAVSGLKD